MFKPTSANTPKEYIELIDEPRKSDIRFLYDFIRKAVPKQKPYIETGMIGFGKYHYKGKSGREGDWAIIALASQKNYISVYVCATDGKEYLAEKYKDKLGKVSVGRSCIRFKKIEDVKLEVLKEIIVKGVQMMQTP